MSNTRDYLQGAINALTQKDPTKNARSLIVHANRCLYRYALALAKDGRQASHNVWNAIASLETALSSPKEANLPETRFFAKGYLMAEQGSLWGTFVVLTKDGRQSKYVADDVMDAVKQAKDYAGEVSRIMCLYNVGEDGKFYYIYANGSRVD